MPLVDQTPAALIDLDDVAEALGIPPTLALTYLDAHGEPPVATYKGRPLWLSDTAHDIFEKEASCGPV